MHFNQKYIQSFLCQKMVPTFFSNRTYQFLNSQGIESSKRFWLDNITLGTFFDKGQLWACSICMLHYKIMFTRVNYAYYPVSSFILELRVIFMPNFLEMDYRISEKLELEKLNRTFSNFNWGKQEILSAKVEITWSKVNAAVINMLITPSGDA